MLLPANFINFELKIAFLTADIISLNLISCIFLKFVILKKKHHIKPNLFYTPRRILYVKPDPHSQVQQVTKATHLVLPRSSVVIAPASEIGKNSIYLLSGVGRIVKKIIRITDHRLYEMYWLKCILLSDHFSDDFSASLYDPRSTK